MQVPPPPHTCLGIHVAHGTAGAQDGGGAFPNSDPGKTGTPALPQRQTSFRGCVSRSRSPRCCPCPAHGQAASQEGTGGPRRAAPCSAAHLTCLETSSLQRVPGPEVRPRSLASLRVPCGRGVTVLSPPQELGSGPRQPDSEGAGASPALLRVGGGRHGPAPKPRLLVGTELPGRFFLQQRIPPLLYN